MVDLSSLLDDEDLRRRYGTPTLDRAWDYVRRGDVLSCTHELDDDGDLDISGAVAGSTAAPYSVHLSVGEDARGLWVFGRCSCPVAEGCKHAVALLITVRDEQARTDPGAGRRWERQLSRCSTSWTSGPSGPRSVRTSRWRCRWTSSHRPGRPHDRAWAQPTGSARGALRMRPMRRGARDNWVRTGISWSDVPYLDRHGDDPPAQVAAVNDLPSGDRTAMRQLDSGADGDVSLGSFGPTRSRCCAAPSPPGSRCCRAPACRGWTWPTR